MNKWYISKNISYPMVVVIWNFNTLTANDEYCRSNMENLPLPIETQLSEKPKIFCCIFIAFLESTLNFEHFEKRAS